MIGGLFTVLHVPSLHRFRRSLVWMLSVVCAVSIGAPPVAAVDTIQGPSSSQAPYLVPLANGVLTESVLTVGDSVGGYPMVGIPDGLGAFDNGDGTLTLLMNHEISLGSGATRAHGANGAFVSRWVIDADTLAVESGDDLIQSVAVWNPGASSYNAPASGVGLSRFCSADLPAASAFYNARSKHGFDGRIFMNGEEVSTGRAFAHLQDGTSYELPRLGKVSFENSVANPDTGNATVVVGLDDTSPLGELHLYVGHKTKTGSPVDRAGLTNGGLFGIVVDGVALESRTDGLGATSKPFSLHGFGDVSSWSAAQLQTADTAAGVTQFLRPEDGAWDPSNPDDFYFVTTDRFDQVKDGNPLGQVGRSRLWRLSFENVQDPAAGGTITMLVDGTQAHQMFDNLTIDRYGHVLIQEDPGGQNYLARIWQYDIASGRLTALAEHDPDRFAPGAPNFLTIDEESSGIIDAESLLGPGWFLLDVQAHYPNGPTLVEGGQLLAIFNPDTAAAAGG
jgi:hypothetical protein